MLKDKGLKAYRGDIRAKLVQNGGLTDPIKARKSMMGTRKHLILLAMICREKRKHLNYLSDSHSCFNNILYLEGKKS